MLVRMVVRMFSLLYNILLLIYTGKGRARQRSPKFSSGCAWLFHASCKCFHHVTNKTMIECKFWQYSNVPIFGWGDCSYLVIAHCTMYNLRLQFSPFWVDGKIILEKGRLVLLLKTSSKSNCTYCNVLGLGTIPKWKKNKCIYFELLGSWTCCKTHSAVKEVCV